MSTLDTHAIGVARHQLREVADAYEALGEMALNGADPNATVSQHRERRHEDDRDVTAKAIEGKTPAHLPSIDARMRIAAWVTFLARAVMDATDTEHRMIQAAADGMKDGKARDEMQALADAARPWRPRSSDPAHLLREIADDHLGVFIGSDPLEYADFRESCIEYVQLARRQAWPTGARWVRLHVPCPETSTDDLGRRVGCTGEYRMWMIPEREVLADMVCDVDSEHRITPAQWFAAGRRMKTYDTAAAARLARTLRLAGEKVG